MLDPSHFLYTIQRGRVGVRACPNSSRKHVTCRVEGRKRAQPLASTVEKNIQNTQKSWLTCGCCSKYPHHRHFLHVALPEFRVADVQVFNGTCQIEVCGDDPHGKHDCRVRQRGANRQKSQKTTVRSPYDARTSAASRDQPRGMLSRR